MPKSYALCRFIKDGKSIMLTSIPLMAIILIVYNGIMLGFTSGEPVWSTPVFDVGMISGNRWSMNIGDMVLAFGLVLLFFEILKATRIGKLSIIDHLLSTVVLILFLIEFLVVPGASTSVFFLLMLMALIDVMAGFSVSIRSATRDVSLGNGGL